MSSAQKIAVAFALIAVVVFLSYTAVHDGGLSSLRPDSMSVASPVSSASVSAAPAPELPATATPVRTPVHSIADPAAVTEASVILSAMNAERAASGVAPLSADATLHQLAQAHASDMVARGYFSHTSPDGVTFQQRVIASGHTGSMNAENLGLTSGAAVEIVEGWMNSDGHRINMLNDEYGQVGIGVAHGNWQGFSVVFAVAVFGNGK
jgi:uncharacterized protein YkwD